eukprot:TRINITY_DN4071_c0_g1_i1.p1 TRINITY_DN4071_c0_g1~~TRINITY_DN4071_c0_g1_i1.p1  ORF type:complete len:361 (-),score=82.04 TRINITY_DN4071_c0_g1_i1:36-1118(-)
MASYIAEIVPFLSDPKFEVRLLALQNLTDWTNDQATREVLKGTEVIKSLSRLIEDTYPIPRHALTCLINLSEDRELLAQMLKRSDLFENVVNCASDPKMNKGLADMYLMLLSNLTREKEGCMKLIGANSKAPGLLVLKLVGAFCNNEKEGEELTWATTVLMNVTQTEEGRAVMIDRKIILDILPFLRHKNILIRRGVVGMLRNCCFASGKHPLLLSPEISILTHILLPLRGTDVLSEDDMKGLPVELHNHMLSPTHTREEDKNCVKLLVEIILLLTATRSSREFLRASNVYVVIRELSKFMQSKGYEDEEFSEMVLKIVEVLVNEEAKHQPEEGDVLEKKPEVNDTAPKKPKWEEEIEEI